MTERNRRNDPSTQAAGHQVETKVVDISSAESSATVGVQVATSSRSGVAIQPQSEPVHLRVESNVQQSSATDVAAVTRSYRPGPVDRWLIGPLICLCAVVVYALVAVRGNVDRLWDILSRIV